MCPVQWTTDVLVRRDGRSCHITLNRPKAINALTLEMVRAVASALDEAEVDESVSTVLIDGAGDRGLCAGGDIRAFYDAALRGDLSPLTFWREQYQLNRRIARYCKPIVAVMDGTVLGGGVGISAHASHRIVTERSRVGMPEVAIGFVPDVGGTWLLPRAPGEVGTHMALTTDLLGPADAIHSGFADHYLPTESLPQLIDALSGQDVDEALDSVLSPEIQPAQGDLAAARSWIDVAYSSNSVEDIIDRLRATDLAAGAHAAEQILAKSPTALAVTLRALRHGRELTTLESCLEAEFRIARTFLLEVPDFIEGIRAVVVDKDRRPRWNPHRLADVSSSVVDHCFTIHADDLDLHDIGKQTH